MNYLIKAPVTWTTYLLLAEFAYGRPCSLCSTEEILLSPRRLWFLTLFTILSTYSSLPTTTQDCGAMLGTTFPMFRTSTPNCTIFQRVLTRWLGTTECLGLLNFFFAQLLGTKNTPNPPLPAPWDLDISMKLSMYLVKLRGNPFHDVTWENGTELMLSYPDSVQSYENTWPWPKKYVDVTSSK